MTSTLSGPAGAAGSVLGAAFGALGTLRSSKPLHPHGAVVPATLERLGRGDWRVPWLDQAGSHRCRIRFSRSIGLPDPLPDILGLALTFDDESGTHDLLLASSGTSPLSRYLLLPRRQPLASSYASLFTYDTPRGAVVLGARPYGHGLSFAMEVARPTGSWQRFGTLRLDADPADCDDERLDLDPVLRPLPGLRLSPALARLREPSYARARRSRAAADPVP